jgi:hypothetical protein
MSRGRCTSRRSFWAALIGSALVSLAIAGVVAIVS